jgi:hypothetical protein
MLTSTAGAGTSSSAVGCAGSTPLAATMGSARATSGLFGRNPNSITFAWFSGVCTKSSNSAAAARSSASTHSVFNTMNGLSE